MKVVIESLWIQFDLGTILNLTRIQSEKFGTLRLSLKMYWNMNKQNHTEVILLLRFGWHFHNGQNLIPCNMVKDLKSLSFVIFILPSIHLIFMTALFILAMREITHLMWNSILSAFSTTRMKLVKELIPSLLTTHLSHLNLNWNLCQPKKKKIHIIYLTQEWM